MTFALLDPVTGRHATGPATRLHGIALTTSLASARQFDARSAESTLARLKRHASSAEHRAIASRLVVVPVV